MPTKAKMFQEGLEIGGYKIPDGSRQWHLKRVVFGGRSYFGIARFVKWTKDNEFHPSSAIMVESDTFELQILPAILELYGFKPPEYKDI